MSTKNKTRNVKILFSCTACGTQASKWSGQCGACGAWNSLVEDVVKHRENHSGLKLDAFSKTSEICSIDDISTDDEIRIDTGFNELNRVLGGGLVQGSVVLIGGDPGIGKSTLLTQTLGALSMQVTTLYVTGEESPQQVSLRARRLNLSVDGLRLLAETEVERILLLADKEKPRVIVIDSIQTIFTSQLQSAPGSVGQVRESAALLVQYAKKTGTALFLVGHVTKEGMLAGPRILEHMVDTVLYFEGDVDNRFRVLRAVKNRFGAVNEMGVFAMVDNGLREISNPSAIFLSRHEQAVSGSVVMVTREGSRPVLLEIQALVSECHGQNPRRLAVGLDQNRLAILLAVLQRHCAIAMYDQDVFINVVGGIRVTETAADLAVVMATLSSLRNQPLPVDLVVFGEVGLAGEVRPVQNGQERLREAAQHGFTQAIVPKANAPKQVIEGLSVIPVQSVAEAAEYYSNV